MSNTVAAMHRAERPGVGARCRVALSLKGVTLIVADAGVGYRRVGWIDMQPHQDDAIATSVRRYGGELLQYSGGVDVGRERERVPS